MSEFKPNFFSKAYSDSPGKRATIEPLEHTGDIAYLCPHPGCTQVIRPFQHKETFGVDIGDVNEMEVLCQPADDPYNNTIQHSSKFRWRAGLHFEAEIPVKPGEKPVGQSFGRMEIELLGTGFAARVNGVMTTYFFGVCIKGECFNGRTEHRLWHEDTRRLVEKGDRRYYSRPYIQLAGATVYLDEMRGVEFRLCKPSASVASERLQERTTS